MKRLNLRYTVVSKLDTGAEFRKLNGKLVFVLTEEHSSQFVGFASPLNYKMVTITGGGGMVLHTTLNRNISTVFVRQLVQDRLLYFRTEWYLVVLRTRDGPQNHVHHSAPQYKDISYVNIQSKRALYLETERYVPSPYGFVHTPYLVLILL